MSILRADRFSPTLFVGLGGSGARVVNQIAGKLRQHPNHENFSNLIHAVCIDTNKADLSAMKNVPDSNRFLISSFDRRSYVERKRGKYELDEDTMLTQWVHDWYQFREAQGAGAGQIRVESRLGLYYNLEEDRAGILRSFNRMLDQSTRPDNPYRDNEDRVINVMIYGSVAGGTGSGGFIPVGYLLQDLIKDHGWGRGNIVATLMLPSVFTANVEQALHADINANGYAALKELEYCTKLGYEGNIEEIEFHVNPNKRERKHVYNRPFAITYLVDKPSELSIDKYTNAIADSAYLQIFSPLIGAQAGEYDNYDKHQKTLALGHFSVHFGSFGAAVLVLPKDDILHYASLRYLGRVLNTYLVSGDDDAFRVPYEDPKFQRLSREEQDRIVDEKYNGYVEHMARLEEDRQEKGVYTSIVGSKGTDGSPLRETFGRRLANMFDALDDQIQLQPFDPLQVHEGNTSLSRSVDNLRRDAATSRTAVMSYLDSQIADLKSGRFFGDFFRENNVGPLAQRYVLIRLKNEGLLTPYEDVEDGAYLHETRENPYDLDKEHVTREFGELEKRLRESTQRGLFSKMKSRENKEFEGTRRKTQDFFTQVEGGMRDWLKSSFWQRFHEELQRTIEARLNAFRSVSAISDEVARNVALEAERLRTDPSSRGEESDAAAYYLDSEIMRDDRAGERMWNRLFAHKLDKNAYYDEDKIFAIIDQAFQPAVDDDGRVRAKDAMEIVKDIRGGTQGLAKDTLGKVLEEMNFDMRMAIEMEARYVATGGASGGVSKEDNERVDRVSESVVTSHAEDKFTRLVDQCVILAAIDKTKQDDPTVTAADIFYVGVSDKYATDEKGSLKGYIKSVATGVDFVDGWDEDNVVVFYRALLGVPLYFYQRVNNELYHSYVKVKAKPNRSYPLHIQGNWEDEIPNLDPIEIKAADEKRRADEAAKREAGARTEEIWQFVLATMAKSVQKGAEGGYEWVVGTIRKKLGADRASSFDAFWKLDPMMRDDLVKAGVKHEAMKTSSAKGRREFRGELESYLGHINEQFAEAYANEDEGATKYLKEEKAVLEERVAGLPAD